MLGKKKSVFDEISKPVNYAKAKQEKVDNSAKFIYAKLTEARENAVKLEAKLKDSREKLDYICPGNENRTVERTYLIANIESQEANLRKCQETIQCYQTAYDALIQK